MDVQTYVLDFDKIFSLYKCSSLSIECRAFIAACTNEREISIFKNIIKMTKEVDINLKNVIVDSQNGFLLACIYNKNLHVIKYLINDLNFDINYVDFIGNNGLYYACMYNENIDVIKFLIYDLKMDIDHKNRFGYKCANILFFSENVDIIKYFIEIIRVNIKDIPYKAINKMNKTYLVYLGAFHKKKL